MKNHMGLFYCLIGFTVGLCLSVRGQAPTIGAVLPPTNVVTGTPVLLWASNVQSGAGLSNVWCAIALPEYGGSPNPPPVTLIWNADTSRYEALYANFTLPGTYVCTFYASDNSGLVSAAVQSSVTGTDAYEPDDTSDEATIFALGDTEHHNFHSPTDEDWVKFYAPTGLVLNVDATQLGTNSDLRLDLYYELGDGSLELLEWADDYGSGANITESVELDLKTTNGFPYPGIFYVRVSSANTNLFGPGSDYTLQIYPPTGGSGGVITLENPGPGFGSGSFYVMMEPPGALAGGAAWQIRELGNQTYYNSTNNNYGLPAPVTYTLVFRAVPGFLPPANYSLALNSDQLTSVLVYYTYNNLSPEIMGFTVSTNQVCKLAYLGYAGKRYRIEVSTNLSAWSAIVTNQVNQDGSLRFSATNPPSATEVFYRARLLQ